MVDFTYSKEDFQFEIQRSKICHSKFDEVLLKAWDEAVLAGYFRYPLHHEKVKTLPGKYGLILQLNPNRAVERRKPETVNDVTTPFNSELFNFNKVKPHEVLMYMQYDGKKQPVLINVSPLDYGHVLLVPDREQCLPQCLTSTSIEMGIHTVLVSGHRGMFVGFNSLCALASVNHLHLHAWYIDRPIHIQETPVKCIKGCLYETTTLPMPAFVLQLHQLDISRLVKCVHAITQHLHQKNIAHNVAMVRGSPLATVTNGMSEDMTVKIYIWPRKSFLIPKLESASAFNVAVAELAGQVPFYIREKFDEVTEDDVLSEIKTQHLNEGEFQTISQQLCSQHADLFTATSHNSNS